MNFDKMVKKAQSYYPDIEIKFKNQSLLMKIISFILFFNKSFMTDYITTINSTVYFPNEEFLSKTYSPSIIFAHEFVHIHDSKNYNFLYSFLYLFPQILFLLFLPLLILFSWKIALISIIFLLPLPAYFRMKFEKRAYVCSLYAAYKISEKYNLGTNLYASAYSYAKNFTGSSYYFMWVFGVKDELYDAINDIYSDKKPSLLEPELYEKIDSILESAMDN